MGYCWSGEVLKQTSMFFLRISFLFQRFSIRLLNMNSFAINYTSYSRISMFKIDISMIVVL